MRTDAGPAPFDRVAIAGLGLIGGSVAAAVRAAWPAVRITGVDRHDVVARARLNNLIDREGTGPSDLADADLIVLATPIPEILSLLPVVARLAGRAVVTDVGSTKRHIMRAASEAGLDTFIGGHPMAGSEHRGLEHARAELFAGQPWLIVPGSRAATDGLARLERLVTAFGARARRLDADTHDRAMAYVSHLPQLVAVGLMNVAGEAVGKDGLALSGRAFREMTRLAASPGPLWQGILSTNADFVSEAAAALAAALPARLEGLDAGRAIETSFDTSARWHEELSSADRR